MQRDNSCYSSLDLINRSFVIVKKMVYYRHIDALRIAFALTSVGSRHAIRFPAAIVAVVAACLSVNAAAQTPPSTNDIEGYSGLLRAAQHNDAAAIRSLSAAGADLEVRDRAGRTPAHVAAFASQEQALRALAEAGANLNALEHSAYDIVTIAAVANDLEFLDLALTLGANPGNVTSPYDGTALIAAAHLGHYLIVERLVAAGAPLDHVNNLGWTALIEAVVLGDGGPDHVATARALLAAGADLSIGDRDGVTPLQHARRRGYQQMAELLGASQ